jgi:hypothetical protein
VKGIALHRPGADELVIHTPDKRSHLGGLTPGLLRALETLSSPGATEDELAALVLVLDQTRPEIGMSVAKVIVPGLRHFWPRFAPGRLYDVPVTMRWLKRPPAEEELNPTAFFF